jgi:hypothetical protein
MANNMKPFSFEEGLALQTKDLAGWRKILTPEAYERLEYRVRAMNFHQLDKDAADAGYDVCRGCTITQFVLEMLN